MTSTVGQGYILIPNWDEFQHYKDRAPAWIKLHLNLLGNDAWLALSTDDRCLLITIWMLVGRYGNGRLKADYKWLMEQAKVGYGPRSRNLERLNDAGFIRFCASPLPKKVASLEVEGSKEPKRKIESARESSPQAAPTRTDNGHTDWAAHTRRERTVRLNYEGVLLENGEPAAREWLEETNPDLVDTIIGHAKGTT